MKFSRYLSTPTVPIRDQVQWKTVEAEWTESGQRRTQTVEVPAPWSQTAANIIASKYFRKAGVPLGSLDADEVEAADITMPSWLLPRRADPDVTTGGETSAHQVFHRLAGCWTYWGWREGYFDDETSARIFFDEIYLMLARQMAAPNSPQWFNTGLHWAYGISGPASGQWAFDREGNVYETQNAYERPQPHACFIQPVADDLVNPGGIMDLWVREVRLFKQGSGTGTNFSTIRSKGERLSGGGVSSGLMSFLSVGDRAAGSIKSGGITRRAAKMVCLDLDHPEVEDFINLKVREESKAAAMFVGGEAIAAAGRGTYQPDVDANIPKAVKDRLAVGLSADTYGIDHMEAEAIRSVDGQNANNSVRVTNAFLELVDNDLPWKLTTRTTGEVVRQLPASDLWTQICRAAWASADPGLQFHDIINKWHTCKADGEIRASNPCGEYNFLDDTACNLASLNLCAFLRGNSLSPHRIFDHALFCHATHFWTVVLDISVSMASFPSKEIALGSWKYRTLGLGYMNLGGLLMRQGLAYDSDEGRRLAAQVTALMHGQALLTSAQLASTLGPFPRWEANRDSMAEVINLHRDALPRDHSTEIGKAILDVWAAVQPGIAFRNAQVTLLAPTGTIHLVTDCDTSGIEPDFALTKHKALAGGGTMKLVNQAVEEALVSLGYPAHQRNSIRAYIEAYNTVEGCLDIEEKDLAVFDCANPAAGFSRCLRPMAHVEMVAAAQPFLSGAVSKTVNMPASSAVADVDAVYRTAHRLGLKAIAIYRDGSKLTQPLTTEATQPKTKFETKTYGTNEHWREAIRKMEEDFNTGLVRGQREYLPWLRTGGFTQKVKIGDFDLFLTANPYPDGRPGEFFMEFAGQGSVLRAMGNLVSILGSLALQYGMPAEKLVDALLNLKFEPDGIVEGDEEIKLVSSIADYVGRKIGSHFLGRKDLVQVQQLKLVEKDEVVALDRRALAISQGYSGDICHACGSIHMARSGTCLRCNDCGETTGCG